MAPSGAGVFIQLERLQILYISVAVSFVYNSVNKQEQITQEMKSKVGYDEVCQDVGKDEGPTHVVTSLTRGFRRVAHLIPPPAPLTTNICCQVQIECELRARVKYQLPVFDSRSKILLHSNPMTCSFEAYC